MTDAAPVRRKNMRRAGVSSCNTIVIKQTTWSGSGDVHIKTTDVVVTQSKVDTPQAVKHELLA
jgi:hypothetical protein